jgi:hypothetical protein
MKVETDARIRSSAAKWALATGTVVLGGVTACSEQSTGRASVVTTPGAGSTAKAAGASTSSRALADVSQAMDELASFGPSELRKDVSLPPVLGSTERC